MVFGIALGVLLSFLLLGAIVRLSYAKGFISGAIHEATVWADAFAQIRPPNWQSLPIDRTKDPEMQTLLNKQFVDAFRLAKDLIAEEMVTSRMEVMLKELGD